MTTNEIKAYAEGLNIKTYRLMYFFGTWVTDCTICAECDKEAIFDCDEIMAHKDSLKNWNYPVALWCGNRRVKDYNTKSIYGTF